jgi:hypothetical protein
LQLDTLVPFFTMAIASSGLATTGAGQSMLSPGRLIFASGALTAAAARGASACVFEIHKVGHPPRSLGLSDSIPCAQTVHMMSQFMQCCAWAPTSTDVSTLLPQACLYKQAPSRAQGGMHVLYPLCSLRVVTSDEAGSVATAPAAANHSAPDASAKLQHDGLASTRNHVLQIQQRLDDGLYHDDDETPGSVALLTANVAGVQSGHGECTHRNCCLWWCCKFLVVPKRILGSSVQVWSSAPPTVWASMATHSAQPLLCR